VPLIKSPLLSLPAARRGFSGRLDKPFEAAPIASARIFTAKNTAEPHSIILQHTKRSWNCCLAGGDFGA